MRSTETDFDMVECFDPESNTCRMSEHCHLRGLLIRATQAYLAVLDAVTLADLVPSAHGAGVRRSSQEGQPLQFLPGLPALVPGSVGAQG